MKLLLILLLTKSAQSANSLTKVVGGREYPITFCPYFVQLHWCPGVQSKDYTDEDSDTTTTADPTDSDCADRECYESSNSNCTDGSNCNPDNSTSTDSDNKFCNGKGCNSTNMACGATIITSLWVLTACHCVYSLKCKDIVLWAGSEKNGQGTPKQPCLIICHGLYENSKKNGIPRNDVAVMKVSEPYDFSDKIQPIPLTRECEQIGEKIIVCGLGSQREGDYCADNISCVTIPIINCSDSSYSSGCIDESMFCAGYLEGGKDACQGDSGGTAKSKSNGTMVGIVSWGWGCARAGYPGVYVRVCYYWGWINYCLNKYDCTNG